MHAISKESLVSTIWSNPKFPKSIAVVISFEDNFIHAPPATIAFCLSALSKLYASSNDSAK